MADYGVFDLHQTVDPDGYVRLALLGELDHASSDGLLKRVTQLRASGQSVRLDLSRLTFIDSGGVRAVLLSVQDATRENWRFEIDPQVSWHVQRVFDVLGVDAVLWPQTDSTG